MRKMEKRGCGFDTWSGSRKWQLTPLFLPAEFHGQRSLVGPHLWGYKESDLTEQLTDSSPFLDSQWDSGYDWNSYILATLYFKRWKRFCRYNQIPNQLEFFNREIIFDRFDLIRWAFKKVGFFLKKGIRRVRESCGISMCGGSHVAGTWEQHQELGEVPSQ